MEVEFKNLPNETTRKRSNQRFFSDAFLTNIATMARNRDDLTVSLEKSGWMSLAEVAYLASFIRQLASDGKFIRVRLPNSKSGWALTLHHLDFARCLGFREINQRTWHSRIDFGSYRPPAPKSGAVTSNIVSLRWIELDDFLHNGKNDLYKVDPSFQPGYIADLRQLLMQRKFISRQTLDLFMDAIFRELAWNAVLHSADKVGTGFAVFAGQVMDSSKLEFALVDTGKGINANLTNLYRNLRGVGEIYNFQDLYDDCDDEQAAVLRFAFEPTATSRTAFPSSTYEHSDRGLKLVSDIFKEHGTLALASGQYQVSVQKRFEPDGFDVSRLENSIMGTSLFGNLPVLSQPATPDDFDLDEIDESAYVSIAPAVSTSNDLEWDDAFIEFLFENHKSISTITVDTGNTIIDTRGIESLVSAILNRAHLNLERLRVVNIAEGAYDVDRILKNVNKESNCQLQLIHSDGRVLECEAAATKNAAFNVYKLSSRTHCKLSYYVNSSYIATSLDSKFPGPGFFNANIHLLSGDLVDKYFSLVDFFANSPLRERNRWVDFVKSAIDTVRTTKDPLKLIGFSGSLTGLFTELEKQNDIEKLIIRSYDFPTADELSEVISGSDQVLLCTDVISTGSLLTQAITELSRLGATPIGVIALCHAGDEKFTWYSLRQHLGIDIPILVGGKLERSLLKKPDSQKADFKIDPGSAVPVRTKSSPPSYKSQIDETRQLIIELDAFDVGHFINGLRHTSIRIDTRKLAGSPLVIERTNNLIESVLKKTDWKNFNPEVVLVPDGLNNIYKMDAEVEIEASQMFSMSLMSEHFPNCERTLSITRIFEPGGKARCGAIQQIRGLSYEDLLLIDDGYSSGFTIRSVVQQALAIGAKRILIVPMLARTSIEDIEQWQSTSEMTSADSGQSIRIKLVSPLVLPIEFNASLDCPQCSAVSNLGERANENTIRGWQSIKEDLEVGTYELSDITDYKSQWLNLFTLTLLAAYSADAFEELKGLLEKTKEQPVDDRTFATTRLFLIESNLLEAARFRQVIRNTVLEIAITQLNSSVTDDERFVEALSLVRSISTDTYLSLVETHLDRIINSEQILDRMVFHLETITDEYILDRRNFISGKIANTLSVLPQPTSLQIHYSEVLIGISQTPATASDVLSKIQRLKDLHEKPEYSHELKGVLGLLERLTQEAEAPKTERFDSAILGAQEDWIQYRQIIENTLFPLLKGIESLLHEELRLSGQANKISPRYLFNDDQDIKAANLASDIKTISESLSSLNDGLRATWLIDNLSKATGRVLTTCIGSNNLISIAAKALDPVQSIEILDLIASVLPIQDWNTRKQLLDPDLVKAQVFLPKSLLNKLISQIGSNLEKHVIENGIDREDLKVEMSIDRGEAEHKQYLLIQIYNNAKQRTVFRPPVSMRTKMLNKELEAIDAAFVPSTESENNFDNKTIIRLRTVA